MVTTKCVYELAKHLACTKQFFYRHLSNGKTIADQLYPIDRNRMIIKNSTVQILTHTYTSRIVFPFQIHIPGQYYILLYRDHTVLCLQGYYFLFTIVWGTYTRSLYVGGVVRKLKHLTTAIRLDYHDFMNTVEQTLFYAAQQAEASLHDYEPKTLLVSSIANWNNVELLYLTLSLSLYFSSFPQPPPPPLTPRPTTIYPSIFLSLLLIHTLFPFPGPPLSILPSSSLCFSYNIHSFPSANIFNSSEVHNFETRCQAWRISSHLCKQDKVNNYFKRCCF